MAVELGKRNSRGERIGSGEGRHVLAVDPGQKIGVAWCPIWLAKDWNASMVGHEELLTTGRGNSEPKAVMRILSIMLEFNVSAVVYEKFQHYPGRVLKGNWASAVRVPAMLAFALEQKWVITRLHEQSSSQALGVITDDRLRASGLWIPGKKDARAAVKHLMLFLRRIERGEVEA
jgi:hypothetical protein